MPVAKQADLEALERRVSALEAAQAPATPKTKPSRPAAAEKPIAGKTKKEAD